MDCDSCLRHQNHNFFSHTSPEYLLRKKSTQKPHSKAQTVWENKCVPFVSQRSQNSLTEFSLKGNIMMMDASSSWANICAPPDRHLLRQKGWVSPTLLKHLKPRLPLVPSPRKELRMHWMPAIILPYSNNPRKQHGADWVINIPLVHYPPVKGQTDDPGTAGFYSSHSQGGRPDIPDLPAPRGSALPVLEVFCSTRRTGVSSCFRLQDHSPSNKRDRHFKKEKEKAVIQLKVFLAQISHWRKSVMLH